jgi:hypothetical protein
MDITWVKSSRSTQSGSCVEVTAWRKSTRSEQQGACVEIAVVTTPG